MKRLLSHLKVGLLALFLPLCTIFLLLASRPGSTSASNEVVHVWETTADQTKLLQPQPDVLFAPDGGAELLTIDVSEAITYQQMDGFGASLTDSSAWLITNTLDAAQRDALLDSLFSPTTGIGLSFLRQPMGASDFSASGSYSYDDMPPTQTDPALDHFSIDHDRAYIIPLLKQIKTINPALKLMASPWSPPGWMKTSDALIGGTLKAEAYAPLAGYFVKFIQAYAAEGLPIDLISVQNEPAYIPPGYPGMGMSSSEQANFIKNNLGPAFAAAGMLTQTKILAWDHNWSNSYPYEVLGDAAAGAYIAGTAYHCYGGSVESQSELHAAFPDKGIWFTECSGFDCKSSAQFAESLRYTVQTLVIGVTRNWGKSIVHWNLALDETHGPQNGGCSNCAGIVTIDRSTVPVTYTYNADYYGLGHISKFVAPGAYRIDANTYPGRIESVAFKNPDGTQAVVVFNADIGSHTFKIRWGGEAFRYTLPAGAAATFTWSGTWSGVPAPTPAPTVLSRTNWIATAFSSPTICCQDDTPPRAIDGSSATRWSSGVAQAPGNQWFQVDMRSPQAFNQIVLDAGSGGDYLRGYQVFVSNNGTDWGNPIAGGAGSSLTTIYFPTQTARYFRIVQTGSAGSWWSIYELNAYHLPFAAPPPTSWPYPGVPTLIPGTIQAESFDIGGESRGYHDSDAANHGDASRICDGVDIEVCQDVEGGYDVGYTTAGEWLRYTVDVTATGFYTFNARVASPFDGASFHAEMDGNDLTGNLAAPNTGDWQAWATVGKRGIYLRAGQHVLRIVMDSSGGPYNSSGNYNYFYFGFDTNGNNVFLPVVLKNGP